MRAFAILFLIVLNLGIYSCQTPESIASKNIDAKITPGMNIMLIDDANVKMYVTFSAPNENQMKADLHLLTVWTKADLLPSSGMWAGINFNSDVMCPSDMFTFHYWPDKVNSMNGEEFMCGDCWCAEGTHAVMLDVKFTELGGKVDIINSSFSFSNIDVDGFKSYLKWTSVKDISNPDQADWQDIKNWQTNNGKVRGAYGLNKAADGMPSKHTSLPAVQRLTDGVGLNTSYLPISMIMIMLFFLMF